MQLENPARIPITKTFRQMIREKTSRLYKQEVLFFFFLLTKSISEQFMNIVSFDRIFLTITSRFTLQEESVDLILMGKLCESLMKLKSPADSSMRQLIQR